VGGVSGELVYAALSLLSREIQGISPISGLPERIRSEITEHFGRRNVKFPVTRNREFYSVNRKFQANKIGVQSAVMQPAAPF
jgi:hypothetical protein